MISKSSYKRFAKCPKSLWLHFNKPDEAREMTDIEKKDIENGNIVGELARRLFADTVNCSVTKPGGEPIYDMQIEATRKAIEAGADAIAEASFLIDNLFCAVDVLKKDGDGYSIYEVKSSLNAKQSQLLDIAFQKYVLEKCGIKVKHIYLVRPNRDYAFHGTLDLHGYFKIDCVDADDSVAGYYKKITDTIKDINAVMSCASEPAVGFCANCKDCEFEKYCSRFIPEDCVGALSGIGAKAYEMYNKGTVTIADFVRTPEYNKGNENQRRNIQIEKALKNDDTPYIDKIKLGEFLNKIRYPLYHLDFETTSKIVPEFDGFHPKESYPFQYSLHIEHSDGTVEHREFLGEEENCIRTLAEQLVRDVPVGSQLIAFHSSTEIGVIKYLAGKFPDLSGHLLDLSENFVDLLEPFKKGFYFDPKQKGSNSIKEVMPALCPEMAEAYHKLPVVHNGGEALAMFPKLIAMKGTAEYDVVRKGMLEYCGLDTLSMVEILRVLKNSVK